VAPKFDGSRARRAPGRPRIDRDVEELILRMAEENRSWGYDRIVGSLSNLGHEVSDQTVGNVLRRHGIPPAPERKRRTTWAEFIRIHLAVLAGIDIFTARVLMRGLVTYYMLFFIYLQSHRIDIAGITNCPNKQSMQQLARHVTILGCGDLRDRRYLLHVRDTKYSTSFRAIIETCSVETLAPPMRSPLVNVDAESSIVSAKNECSSEVIPFGERSLRRTKRNHQGKSNILLLRRILEEARCEEAVWCRERLGEPLLYHHQHAA
jgi:putative transposase